MAKHVPKSPETLTSSSWTNSGWFISNTFQKNRNGRQETDTEERGKKFKFILEQSSFSRTKRGGKNQRNCHVFGPEYTDGINMTAAPRTRLPRREGKISEDLSYPITALPPKWQNASRTPLYAPLIIIPSFRMTSSPPTLKRTEVADRKPTWGEERKNHSLGLFLKEENVWQESTKLPFPSAFNILID